jgi:hypothetical protein
LNILRLVAAAEAGLADGLKALAVALAAFKWA